MNTAKEKVYDATRSAKDKASQKAEETERNGEATVESAKDTISSNYDKSQQIKDKVGGQGRDEEL